MGSGYLRRKKMMGYAVQVKQMQEETKQLVEDPEGAFQRMAKPLITQLQAATYEKNKLSALVCTLLEAQGGTVTVKRGAIDQFQRHRITILSETTPEDDGVNPEVEITFTFKSELIDQPPIDQPPATMLPSPVAAVTPAAPDTQEVSTVPDATDTELESKELSPHDCDAPDESASLAPVAVIPDDIQGEPPVSLITN